jgi:diguanylate cyclase (GGDEF)-like protein
MGLDQNTLFFAAGVCALAVALTILTAWFQNALERFLLWGCIGMVLLGCGAIAYYANILPFMPAAIIAFTLYTLGFGCVYAGARHIARQPRQWPQLAGLIVLLIVTMVSLIASGRAGAGFAMFNLTAGLFLFATAFQYRRVYHEAPGPVAGMIVLYCLTALSFVFCSTIILHDQQWVMTATPRNIAEDLNAIAAIIAITGIGALSLSLTQTRNAHHHANNARTDSLTGALNRRALVDHLATDPLRPGDALIAFDLDAFKSINDRYGHAFGDQVLREFSVIAATHIPRSALLARMGGEEFLVVLRNAFPSQALAVAETIRMQFEQRVFHVSIHDVFKTSTSIGIAFSTRADNSFEVVFQRADAALYRAKGTGRNKVCTELHSVA